MSDNWDRDWAREVFTDTELAKLRRAAKAIIDTHEPDMFLPETAEYLEFDMSIMRSKAKEILDWLRAVHEDDDNPPAVVELVHAMGCAIGVMYLTDDEWEYDEELSDHATYFGSREWFIENMLEDDDDE